MVQRIIPHMVYSRPHVVPPLTPKRKDLYLQVGQHATGCTTAFIDGRRADLVRESALFLHTLASLWEQDAVDDTDVWTELLRRVEVSDLLHKLNQPPHRKKKNGHPSRPWRVTTSKLP
ncbi:phosphoribosyl-ATP pyrophosphatase [Acetobacter ghanensis]|uniref:Phosphoribosyl ATP pyrophosphatase n=1 Tax=Acetobacter ghanensis TaxID=431306 RepID=A0A0U5F3E3_9PROT|nr:phosphoribosyl-ATP pyrophosphatase [Acetobacter ghanensis]GBQ49102.1 phosphoribosyl ATP pyrophosphatase [Acetobacter ghanensis DSM 18895]CEF53421.1 phosphoribosyl ATP pyrophosphatase [Acetobacter ghanensis]